MSRTMSRAMAQRAFAIVFAVIIGACFAAFIAPVGARALSANDFGTGESPFYLYVEKGSFSITVFMKDADGQYTIPLETFPTAIGRSSRMTPTGRFSTGSKEEWHSWGSSYSPYAVAYYPGLYVHGPLYGRRDFANAYSNSVAQIGSMASSGCLRTTAEAAYFVYEHCPPGTTLHIVSGSPIGFYAEKAVFDEQKIDPATLTLDDILPSYKQNKALVDEVIRLREAEKRYSDGKPHAAAQKTEAAGSRKDSIGINRREIELKAGGSYDLSADATGAVKWMTTDAAVASVDGDGVIKAVAAGKAKIVAISDDGSAFSVCYATVAPGANTGSNGGKNGAGGATGNGTGGGRGSSDSAGVGSGVGSGSGRVLRTLKPARVSYADVSPLHFAYDAIGYLIACGAADPSANEFRPDDDITTAEFVKMLVAAREATAAINNAATAGSPAISTGELVAAPGAVVGAVVGETTGVSGAAAGTGYDAAQSGLWFNPYYDKALAMGILTAGQSSPLELEYSYLKRSAMTELAKRAGAPADSVQKSGGAMGLYEDGNSRPDGFVTRAEAAVAIYNML